MRLNSARVLPALCVLSLASAAHAISVPNTFPVLVPVANPLSGATLLNTIDGGEVQYGAPNLSTPIDTTDTYLAGKINLTTQVYRTAGGTLAFSYRIDSESFPAPYTSPPPTILAFPRLAVPGYAPYTADVSGAADYGAIAARAAFNDTILFDFVSGDAANRGFTQFYTLFAGDSATLFVLTDATTYQTAVAKINLDGFLPGELQSFGIETPFATFAPAPVPEPLTVALLPLAIGALALRHRRQTTSK